MQSYCGDRQFNEGLEPKAKTELEADALASAALEPFTFEAHFQGNMFMYSPRQAVAEYLDAHEGWFPTCAQPMHAEPLGENGYVLTIGRFGAFGYEVEPKMGVVLQPPASGLYNMYSVPVPGYTPPGYEVDYRAVMQLAELARQDAPWAIADSIGPRITRVEWQLHLFVTLHFPHFIHRLPQSLIQSTGDRLLAQIVRQISPRLTDKVQQDFHHRLHLPLPPKRSRHLENLRPPQ